MSSNRPGRAGAGMMPMMAAACWRWPRRRRSPRRPSHRQAKPQDAPAAAAAESDPDDPQRYFETVTVSATLNPTTLKDTPGTVSVIDAEAIARRMMENTADLVKFEPGVYIESNITRVGLNGFNIRGIGGNRVMTQVDGVETSEQFDFGPFNVHQFSLDLDTLKTRRDRPQRRLVALRQRRARRRGVLLHQGSGRLPRPAGRSTSAARRSTTAAPPTPAATSSSPAAAAAFRRRCSPATAAATSRGTRARSTPQDADADGAEPAGPRAACRRSARSSSTFADGNVLRGAVEVTDTEVDTEAYSSRTRRPAHRRRRRRTTRCSAGASRSISRSSTGPA